MEPHQDPITALGSSSQTSTPLISKTGEEENRAKHRADPMLKSPSYKPLGYPEFGTLWSQPPQPLPGPDDHPFFKWIAEGAKKDPTVLATSRSVLPTQFTTQSVSTTTTAPSVQSAIQLQSIYPVMWGPSAAMEPITPPLQEKKKSFIQSSPSTTTPDLSSSPTESSPFSAHTATPTGVEKTQLQKEEPEKSNNAPTSTSTTETGGLNTESECMSIYLRIMTDAEAHRPLALRNGQIWRSGSKRDGWRRPQWSTDVG
jgi:hypothetical protein